MSVEAEQIAPSTERRWGVLLYLTLTALVVTALMLYQIARYGSL